jgi:hypothetical protein
MKKRTTILSILFMIINKNNVSLDKELVDYVYANEDLYNTILNNVRKLPSPHSDIAIQEIEYKRIAIQRFSDIIAKKKGFNEKSIDDIAMYEDDVLNKMKEIEKFLNVNNYEVDYG